MRPVIAVIGGTGLENPEIMKDKKELETQTTPWGEASTICTGIVGGEKIFILSRHGKNHDKSPTQGTTAYVLPTTDHTTRLVSRMILNFKLIIAQICGH